MLLLLKTFLVFYLFYLYFFLSLLLIFITINLNVTSSINFNNLGFNDQTSGNIGISFTTDYW